MEVTILDTGDTVPSSLVDEATQVKALFQNVVISAHGRVCRGDSHHAGGHNCRVQ
jgi:hypothetical protein